MKIAVTGAMGFIGERIVRRLLEHNNDVTMVDFWKDIIPSFEKNKLPILPHLYRNIAESRDIRDPYDFLNIVTDFDVVVHAGAIVDTLDMGTTGDLWRANVDYTRELVKRMLTRTHLVFISSASVYGNGIAPYIPLNPYAVTKVIGEKIAREHGQTTPTILRLFNVFGQHEHHKGMMASMPWKIANAYRTGAKMSMHSLLAQRDFVPVDTVADYVLAGCTAELKGVHDVGTGSPTSFADLDNFIMQATKNYTSCVNEIAMPFELEGRYQTYTRANVRRADSDTLTRDYLIHYYGNH